MSSPSTLTKLPRLDADPLLKLLPKILTPLPKVPGAGFEECGLNGVDGVPNECRTCRVFIVLPDIGTGSVGVNTFIDRLQGVSGILALLPFPKP